MEKTRPHGPITYPWQNSYTISDPTQPLENPHFSLSWATTPRHHEQNRPPSSGEKNRRTCQAQDEAQAAHELACQLMKNRIRGKTTTFEIGDKVWLKARNLRRNVVDPKFAPKREGPFKIKKVLSTLSYQLDLPKSWKIHLTFHISLLSPYKETDTHGPNYIRPPPELVNSEEEYEVERILKH